MFCLPLLCSYITRKAIVTRSGFKIGLVSAAEDWIDVTVPGYSQIQFNDFSTVENLARELKEEDGVDLVTAITHNRLIVDRSFSGIS
jgi:F420-0:gamma-glutamyl ligase-like protein